jgi:hypothetical protein
LTVHFTCWPTLLVVSVVVSVVEVSVVVVVVVEAVVSAVVAGGGGSGGAGGGTGCGWGGGGAGGGAVDGTGSVSTGPPRAVTTGESPSDVCPSTPALARISVIAVTARSSAAGAR